MTEITAQFELARRGFRTGDVLERRFVGPQLLELVLREIANHQSVALEAPACKRGEFTGDRLHQRGLARAVCAEQAEACTRLQGELQVLDDRAAGVAERGILQREQRRG